MATRVPFGTMLAAAALVASLYGERLLAWYLSTMQVMNRLAFILLSLTAMVAALVAGARVHGAAAVRGGAPGERAAAKAPAPRPRSWPRRWKRRSARLRTREQAMTARAEASERLSDEIIASLTSGLLVVGDDRPREVAEPGRAAAARACPKPTGAATSATCCSAPRRWPGLIEECLDTGQPVRRRDRAHRHARRSHDAPRRHRVADRRRQRHAARRDLPVQRSDRHRRARGAAAAEGQPGAGRRADGRHRARVPQRPGDDSRLRAAARSRSAARRHASLRPRHPRRDRHARRRRPELPQLRAAGGRWCWHASRRRAIVERAADEIRARGRRRAAARSTVRGEFVPVQGDEVLLRQAFSNLCRNALEACTEAGITPHIVDREHRRSRAARSSASP